MVKTKLLRDFEVWLDSYLNFEKTPQKNIFWLDTMRFLCEKFQNPENASPCFHVAGSKGKGSVSVFIASILDEAGYKTGLYTSPHILEFFERVSSPRGFFDAETYEKAAKELMEGVSKINEKDFPKGRAVTWFELVTLFAFLTFREAKTDFSVFEVGLGGRLDSTNVIFPVCSCITPLELEHTEFLGDTIGKIAYEKGGIIKEDTPVVIARQKKEARKVLEKIAKEKNARAIFVEDEIKNLGFKIKPMEDESEIPEPEMEISFSSSFFKRPIRTSLKMLGKFQAENAALASLAVKIAVPEISEEIIERGLKKARLPARFEIIKNPKGFEGIPFLILDGAHTVNSEKFTMETFSSVFGQKSGNSKRTLLFACAADKDAKDIAPLFKKEFDSVFLTRPGNVKQSDLSALQKAFDEAEIKYDLNEDFENQIKKALENSQREKSILLVTGSFYLISELKKFISNTGGLPAESQ